MHQEGHVHMHQDGRRPVTGGLARVDSCHHATTQEMNRAVASRVDESIQIPVPDDKGKRVKREEKYMYLDEKIDLIHQMSWKIKCKRFGCHISDVNIRNPILAKPHVWES